MDWIRIRKNRYFNIWMLAGLLVIFVSISFFTCHQFVAKVRFTGKDKSIAVLPFINLSGNKENEYLNDGMTDEIITRLSEIDDLKVISRQAMMNYKGSKKNSGTISKELHVSAVLEGGVEKSGDELKIYARLTDANTGKIIWTANYIRNIKDILVIQSELAQLIAEQLKAELTEGEKRDITRRPTQSLEAYNEYLKGRYYYFLKNVGSLRKGIICFNQAVRIDSGLSQAWSGLADCYAALGYGSYNRPSEVFLQAEKAAYKALQLDSTLAEPHTSLGYIQLYYYWNWKAAENEFLKAIRLNPKYVPAYTSYGYYLTAMERFPEARMMLEKALQMDPVSPATSTDLGFNLYYSHNYDQAVNTLKSALESNPKAPLAHLWLGRTYQEQKKYPESVGEYSSTLQVNRDWPVAYAAIGYVYGVMGQKQEAEKILTKMKTISDSVYVTPYGFALLYAGLGEKDKAFECLEKAYTERSNWLVWLKLDPRWTMIRNDKRYTDLIAKIGLPKNINPLGRQ